MRWHITIEASRRHRRKNHQKYERKITSAKIRAQFYERKTRNSIRWKFLGNHMLEISWKLNAGKFFGNYMLVTS